MSLIFVRVSRFNRDIFIWISLIFVNRVRLNSSPSYSHYTFSAASALYIFHHMNELSFLLMLENVFFLRYSDDQRGFLCYAPKAQHTRISHNFIEHNPFYSRQILLSHRYLTLQDSPFNLPKSMFSDQSRHTGTHY